MLFGLARIEQTMAEFYATGFGLLEPNDNRVVRRGHMLAYYDSQRELWIRARVLKPLMNFRDGYGGDQNDRDERLLIAYRLVAIDRCHLVCVKSCE